MAGALMAMLFAVSVAADAAWRPAATVTAVWQVSRDTQSASGARLCRVVSQHHHVTVVFSAPSGVPVSVEVGFGNTPGSLRYLRIGRAIFQTDRPRFEGGDAADIARRLSAPGEFAVEWEAGEHRTRHHGLYATGAFAARAEACRQWLRGDPA